MDTSEPVKPPGFIGTRHRQVCIIFFGLVICYFQRTNMTVGIVAMTDPSPAPGLPAINYSMTQQGTISGSFYWGYALVGIPAGYLADKYGPVRLMSLVGGVTCGLLTMAIPTAATYLGYEAVLALRTLQGVGQGVFYPSTQAFLSKWAIPQEREKFAWVWSGCQLGTIIMMPLGGAIATTSSGWPAIFYCSGALAITWGLFCFIFGADSPAKHKSISKMEQDYIEINFQASAKKGKNMKMPYKAIATSIPVWALLICQAADNWGFSLFITMISIYLRGMYDIGTASNGFLSALPYLAMFLCTQLFSYLGGHLRGRTSVNFNRKFWNSVAVYGSAAAVLPLAFYKASATGAVVLITLANGIGGAIYLGYLSNHLDLSPNYAGFLLGITNAFGNIPSIISPMWAGSVVQDPHSMEQWRTVFIVFAIVKIVGNTIFIIFGSTTVQPWNDPDAAQTPSDMEGKPPDNVLHFTTNGKYELSLGEQKKTNEDSTNFVY